jgi:type IV pilus assembly protein PilV
MNSSFRRERSSARSQAGLNLIEVMVAVVVLSLGLLGMGALMGVSVRNTQSANFRTQATNLAADYVDMVRANINNMGRYTIGWTDPATCATAEAPTDFTTCGLPHVCDLARWQRDLCYTLPNGRGRATVARAGGGGTAIDITVDICWSDDRSANAATSATCTNTGETLFRVTSGL